MGEEKSRQRFLDTPYVLQIVALEQVQDLLQPLARTTLSPLPVRMRNACARMHRLAAQMARELRRTPTRVREEKAREDEAL